MTERVVYGPMPISHTSTPDRAFRASAVEYVVETVGEERKPRPMWHYAEDAAFDLECILRDEIVVSDEYLTTLYGGENVARRCVGGGWVAICPGWVEAHAWAWSAERGDTWCADCETVSDFCRQDRVV